MVCRCICPRSRARKAPVLEHVTWRRTSRRYRGGSLTDEHKTWIDAASYEDMLRRSRFSPVGDPMFQGEAGKYFAEVMAEKRLALSDAERVAASKRVGWDFT